MCASDWASSNTAPARLSPHQQPLWHPSPVAPLPSLPRPVQQLASSMKMMSASSTFTSLPTMVTRPTTPSLVEPAGALGAGSCIERQAAALVI